MLLTVTQAIQLAAIGPCIFVILYLMITARQWNLIILPIIYFISLTCSFLLPIISLFPELDQNTVKAFLIFNEHMGPELGFLLILQFILGRFPPVWYWLILALPFIGGGPFVYLTLNYPQVCLGDTLCMISDKVMVLYRVFGSALVFLLLTVIISRKRSELIKDDTHKTHRYWLVIALIIFSLLVVATDLFYISDRVTSGEALLGKTLIAIGFVYLVLVSVFRVFSETVPLKPLPVLALSEKDRRMIKKISRFITEEGVYRDLNFSRATLADRLGVTEQHLSKVINFGFKQTFPELMNQFRMKEAKHLLKTTDKPITVISFDVGFSSITSFNRVFKQATGLSPTEYRKQHALMSLL